MKELKCYDYLYSPNQYKSRHGLKYLQLHMMTNFISKSQINDNFFVVVNTTNKDKQLALM